MQTGKYFSTKKLGPISVAHRQHRDTGTCAKIHGYGRYVQFIFTCNDLDERQWVYDFGDLKEIRKWLEQQWDHRTLLASDDPLLDHFLALEKLDGIDINVMDVTKGWGPGIEASCKFVADHVNSYVKDRTNNRVWLHSVEIWEHEGNSARYLLSNPILDADPITINPTGSLQHIKNKKPAIQAESASEIVKAYSGN